MRISIRSGARPLALSLACCAAVAGAALAQEARTSKERPADPDIRSAMAAEGQEAMERLERAVAKQKKSGSTASPVLPAEPGEPIRRRAFEAMRNRQSDAAAEQSARAALDKARDQQAADREAMAGRLAQALGLALPDMDAVVKGVSPPAQKGWVPVLFVSSSMPIATLRTYAMQLERTKGVLAFRGMPGGMRAVAPMAKLSAEILRIDPGCEGPACAMHEVQLIIDPLVFRQHGISRVPALAMIPGDPTEAYCEREGDSPRASHIVFGDAALSGMLEEYARLGGKEEVRDAQTRLGGR